MARYARYLGSLNLISVANKVIANFSGDLDFDGSYKWRPLEEGFREARTSGKPIFLMLHKMGCPACRNLKSKLARSVGLANLSTRFVMINLEVTRDGVENEIRFQPDGKYVPRILFFTSDGFLIEEAYNRFLKTDEKSRNKYFYSSPTELMDTMTYVLKCLKS